MALFHLSVTQTKRSAGQSAIASAAYRAGERLYSEYYGEYSDYTRKGGVICSDILLPSHAPPEYADRQTLWNAVEKAERGKTAQLAYSFDIALQNEFSLEENIALARQFLLEQFVSRGMVVDFAVHQPDREDGGIPNPHFHVLCPIRPIEQNGKWGLIHLLVDIQAKLSEGKSEGYARWAKRYNLKEMSKTLIFLQENKIGSIEEMQERVDAATARYHELGDSIKASENRLAEIAVLKAHITNYAKTRPVYDAYRKTGYSKCFLETHRTEITLHKAAKAAFNESNLKTLPKVKELDVEYSKLLTEKKARYPDYRKAKEEMQEFLRAKRNVELFFAEEKSSAEKMKSR